MPHATTLDADSVGHRLSERLQERGWGYEEFHRRVREAAGGARGSSYGSVWAYVNGKVSEPRPAVVRAMAEVLDVTYDWLMTGKGPRTVEDAARDRRTEAASPRPSVQRGSIDRVGRLLRAMEEARERMPPEAARLVGRNGRVIEQLVIDLLESDGLGLDRYAEGEVAEATRLVAWLLILPLDALGAQDLPDSRDRSESYLLSMAAAIRLALPEAPHGRPRNVLDRLRRLRASGRSGNAQTSLELPGGRPTH
jgi:transcriptional regulator with XRE-family HTH domain